MKAIKNNIYVALFLLLLLTLIGYFVYSNHQIRVKNKHLDAIKVKLELVNKDLKELRTMQRQLDEKYSRIKIRYEKDSTARIYIDTSDIIVEFPKR